MGTLTNRDLELAEFLKNQSIFQMLDNAVLETLSPLFAEIACGPGHIIFSQGDLSDGLYVIKSGSVAVIKGKSLTKVIAYLTAGECFGEMAEMQETTRSATIRVPEEAVVLRLPTAALKELTRRFPALSSEIGDIISKRVASEGMFKPPGLQGNLAFFDLPTIIQTVIFCRQDGVISLFGRGGRVVGRLVLAKATIAAASFDHLRGENALYELLNSSDPLDFSFDQVETDDTEEDRELRQRPLHMLLIEGARRADELPKLMKITGWPSSVYIQLEAVPDLAAFGPERRDLFRTLWTLIEMGCNTESICKQTTYDRFSVLSGLQEILKAKLVKRLVGRRATDELRRRTVESTVSTKQAIAHNDVGKSFENTSAVLDGPADLAKAVNAFNGVATNLGLLYGKVEVRVLLQDALAKTIEIFPVLKGLRVHIDIPCLDMRGASADFATSPDSICGLLLLGNHLMDLLLRMQNEKQ